MTSELIRIGGIDRVHRWTTLHTNGWILVSSLDFKRED